MTAIDQAVKTDIVIAIEEGRTEFWPYRRINLWMDSWEILDYLHGDRLFDGCVDLADLEVIKAKGIDFFRKYFAGKHIFGWRVVEGNYVPCLSEKNGELVISWCHLSVRIWMPGSFGLRRK